MSNYGKCDVPCLVCGRELDLITAIQPYDGVMCSTSGNYGSRVFDPIDGNDRLAFIVCDDCLTERADRFRAVVVERGPKRVTYGPFVVSPAPRSDIARFAALMERELRANAHKDAHPLSHDCAHLLDELRAHVEKLAESGSEEHAADVGNLAMLILSASSAAPEGERCPGFPHCTCPGSAWSNEEDLHGAFGAPGMMGG